MEHQIAELKNEIERLRTEQEELTLLLSTQSLLLNTVASAALGSKEKQAVSQVIREMLDTHAVFAVQGRVPEVVQNRLKTFADLMAQQAGEQSPE